MALCGVLGTTEMVKVEWCAFVATVSEHQIRIKYAIEAAMDIHLELNEAHSDSSSDSGQLPSIRVDEMELREGRSRPSILLKDRLTTSMAYIKLFLVRPSSVNLLCKYISGCYPTNQSMPPRMPATSSNSLLCKHKALAF